MKRLLTLIISCCSIGASAQIITPEDSLNAGLVSSSNPTVISGYGEVKVEYNTQSQLANANLTRNILFFGHKFNKRIAFFSEMELEDAKVEGGSPSGEVSMEQLFMKFGINNDIYLTAGLFIPRIGIINENHLPTTFNGNDRPYLEKYLIPSTWREIGVGLYGRSRRIAGLNYSAALVNGLNSEKFGNGNGIRSGRYKGSDANATNLALTGALLYYVRGFRIQASAYYGGSAGIAKPLADSLLLNAGAFGTPVFMTEANVQYQSESGFEFKAIGVFSSIKDAESINRAYANNTPGKMWGAYAEVGYNLMKAINKDSDRSLVLFSRFEAMDLNAEVSSNSSYDGSLNKQFLVSGLTYSPTRGVIVKLDVALKKTGTPNPILTDVSDSQFSFINIGLGYSF